MWIEDGLLTSLQFDTDGCGTSLAAGSMATCLAKGLKLEEALCLGASDIISALNGMPVSGQYCAFLVAYALKSALVDGAEACCGTQYADDETGVAGIIGKENRMRVAIPLAEGRLAQHFGHCEQFALLDLEPDGPRILSREIVEPPPHQPGLLPPWLAERGVQVVIAGGMGHRARLLFEERGVEVLTGAPVETPEKLALQYLTGELVLGDNSCDH